LDREFLPAAAALALRDRNNLPIPLFSFFIVSMRFITRSVKSQHAMMDSVDGDRR